MKKKILASLVSILLVAAIIGGATLAEFSSAGETAQNTFSAGTLAMTMNGDEGSTEAVWVSPTNWAPGEVVTGSITFSNTGTIKANHIYFGFKNVTHEGNANLLDKIIVTDISENFNGTLIGNQAASIEGQVGNRDGILTLAEFSSFLQNGYGYYSWDDKSGDGTILAAGDQSDYSLSFTFQFDPNAGNEYQGTKAGFVLMANATQNSSTDGLVCLHK